MRLSLALAILGPAAALALAANAANAQAPAPAAAACERAVLRAPSAGEVLADAGPTLSWDGDARGPWRVQVALVEPEAGLVASHDLEVRGNRWVLPPPGPRAPARLAVKVLVSRACLDLGPQDLNAMPPAFFIDRRGGCRIDAASLQVLPGPVVGWQPVAAAQAYEVRWFTPDAPDAPGVPGTQGTQGTQGSLRPAVVTVASPRLQVPPGTPAGQVLAVHPVCAGMRGPAAALVWTGPAP